MLIEAIAQIGCIELGEKDQVAIDQFIENPGYSNCIHILLQRGDNGSFVWEGCEVEEQKSDFRKYLFRGGSSRGVNYSPTAKITTIENTYQQKVLGWFRKICKNNRNEFFCGIQEVLEKEKEHILQELQSKLALSSERTILSLKVDGSYLYDIPKFRDAFLFLINEKDLELSASNQVCSICGQRKDTVIGKMSVFRFYTLDKPGFITGGLDEEKAWRNYPVCLSCKSYIEEGRRFIEEKLRFQFYGFSYLLIPKLIVPVAEDDDSFAEVLEYLSSHKKEVRIHHKQVESFMTTEEDVMDILKDMKNIVSIQLLFLQKIQSAERILLLIEDVLPSRISELFKAKSYVEQLLYAEGNHPFHFGFIRTFFHNSYDKYFLHIIESVFKKRQLSISFLAKFIMEQLRKELPAYESGEPSFFYKTRQAIAMIVFLEQAGVLPVKGGAAMSEKFDVLFEKYGKQLDTPEKKAVFLLGSLTQMLLDIQQNKRGSKPFLKQLMGLKMDERTVKGLLPKVINKLEEYESYHFIHKQLAEEISTLFLLSSPRWKMSVDELNFYFACGMNLVSKVKESLIIAKEEA